MRKLIVWNVMTLDGYFEGPTAWDLDMHGTVWGDELEAFSLEQGEEIGTLLFGRRTYEGMAAHWTQETGEIADMMNGIEKAVASRTLESADWNNTRLLSGEATESVKALKAEDGKDVFIFGSAELVGALLAAGLVDEYRVCLAPAVLGTGNPLFKPGSPRRDLDLLESRPLKTGGVLLRYGVRWDGAQGVFIHAAGRLAEGSGPLVAYLEDELGAGFEVTAPEMPNPDAPEAEAWEGAVDALLADLL